MSENTSEKFIPSNRLKRLIPFRKKPTNLQISEARSVNPPIAHEESSPRKYEVSRENYFNKLDEIDKQHLQSLISNIALMSNEEFFYSAYAVGSSVSGIRHHNDLQKISDIDVIIELPPVNASHNQNYFDRVSLQYNTLHKLIQKITDSNNQIINIKEIPPAIDEEFDNPSLLKHDGTIVIEFDNGRPIELQAGGSNIEKTLASGQKGKFVVLN